MSERLVPFLITLAILLGVLALMWLGWRRRQRRDSALIMITEIPEQLTEILGVEAFYVASTRAGEPLERLALRGLGFRSRAHITVATEGVVIAARGEYPVFIAATQIAGAKTATWTIDRVVERDGLIVVAWSTEGQNIDSYLRVIDQDDHTAILDAIAQIAAAPISTPTESEITA